MAHWQSFGPNKTRGMRKTGTLYQDKNGHFYFKTKTRGIVRKFPERLERATWIGGKK
jgi:hypothetical protein